MPARKLLFGDDESPSADLAWLWINCHSWPNWRVKVIHAVDPGPVKVSSARPEPHRWEPSNPRRAFAEAGLDDVELLTVDEDPRLALIRPADLLVIGPRGKGVLKAMHVGSTAEWLITCPPSPLVVVRHGRRTRTAVVCNDGSPNAAAATEALSRLPWAGQLAVTVVAVEDGRADVDGGIDNALATLGKAGVVARQVVLHGEPIDELLHYLDDRQPDLVVLGASSLTGVQRLAIESPANVVAHSTQHTVLLASEHGHTKASTLPNEL